MGIIDDARNVADLVKKLGNIDLYEKIIDLRGQILEITEEKLALQDKVKQLEACLNLRKNMSFKEPFYYQEGDRTPYCPRCFEKDQHTIHVVMAFSNSERTRWDCPECKQMLLLNADKAREHLRGHF